MERSIGKGKNVNNCIKSCFLYIKSENRPQTEVFYTQAINPDLGPSLAQAN